MLVKHLKLPKFYAPSEILTLGAEKFLGEEDSLGENQPQRALKLRTYLERQITRRQGRFPVVGR
jgi:hypothetical protein